MDEIRRDDGELCGHVTGSTDGWTALAVFGGVLGHHPTRDAAMDQVLEDGLASLARHWQYRAGDGDEWQIVCIQEATTQSVRIALDYYSMPGVPTVTLTRAQVTEDGALILR